MARGSFRNAVVLAAGLVVVTAAGGTSVALATASQGAGQVRHRVSSAHHAASEPSPALVRSPAALQPAAPEDVAALTEAPAQVSLQGYDVADPFVLSEAGRWYLYSSMPAVEPPWYLIPARVATTWGEWSQPTNVLARLPSWSSGISLWSPDVLKIGRSSYVMYFTASNAINGHECIGLALGSSPMGQFEPVGGSPLVCQTQLGGDVDPRTFEDGGKLWLYWKADSDELPGKPPSSLWVQQLSHDGTRLLGQPTELLTAQDQWQNSPLGFMAESPDMVHAAGHYWLFYSGSSPFRPTYGIGYAECVGPAGPCTDATTSGPWLGSNAQGSGPGEESLFQDAQGRWWLLYNPNAEVYMPEIRPLATAQVAFSASGPLILTGSAVPALSRS